MRVILGFILGCCVWNGMQHRDVVGTVHEVVGVVETVVDRVVEVAQ